MKISEVIETKKNEKINLKHFIKADELSSFWLSVFDFAFTSMLKKSFFSVRIKNAENYFLRDISKGTIIYSAHQCWWDGIVIYILARKVFNTTVRMMIEELHRFPLLAKVGGFSIEKDSPYSSIRALNYCVELLENPEINLFLFPQGIVMPPDFRPVEFAGGISYLCKRLNGVNLLPIAHRYTFLREDRPEILIEIGSPIVLNDNSLNRKEFTDYLQDKFTHLLDNQRNDISRGNMEGYEFLLKSRLCVPKLIEKHFKPITKLFSSNLTETR